MDKAIQHIALGRYSLYYLYMDGCTIGLVYQLSAWIHHTENQRGGEMEKTILGVEISGKDIVSTCRDDMEKNYTTICNY